MINVKNTEVIVKQTQYAPNSKQSQGPGQHFDSPVDPGQSFVGAQGPGMRGEEKDPRKF